MSGKNQCYNHIVRIRICKKQKQLAGFFNTGRAENFLNPIFGKSSSLKMAFLMISSISLSALNQVKNTCFGLKLDKSYKEQIQLYKAAYQLLGIKISPKVHALVTHMPQFLDSMQKNYHEKGLGFGVNKHLKTVHYDFKQLYEQGYKVLSYHKLYSEKLLRSVIVYNSRNSHFKI